MNLYLIAFLSYILGSIPFSYIVARFYKKNLYEIGSKNIGVANVYRATGKLWPAFVALVGDVGKGFLPIVLAQRYGPSENLLLAQALAVFFAVAGHNWPVFLKFKGGKGLATLAGAMLALSYQSVLLVVLVIILFIFLTEFLTKKRFGFERFLQTLTSQVLGRVIGIAVAAVLVYILYPSVFQISIGAAILAGIKHVKRTKDFLAKK